MSSIINKLYQMKNGGSLSQQDCMLINAALVTLKAEEIPSDQHDNVTDYLVTILNHNSVELRFVSQLDGLLRELQKNGRRDQVLAIKHP